MHVLHERPILRTGLGAVQVILYGNLLNLFAKVHGEREIIFVEKELF